MYQKSDAVLISFRPEDVVIHTEAASLSATNTFDGKITASVFSGDYSEVRVNVKEHRLRVKVAGDRVLKRGDEVALTISAKKTRIVEKRQEEKAEVLVPALS
jgi:ABC-type sugar transport system ATPase subunit